MFEKQIIVPDYGTVQKLTSEIDSFIETLNTFYETFNTVTEIKLTRNHINQLFNCLKTYKNNNQQAFPIFKDKVKCYVVENCPAVEVGNKVQLSQKAMLDMYDIDIKEDQYQQLYDLLIQCYNISLPSFLGDKGFEPCNVFIVNNTDTNKDCIIQNETYVNGVLESCHSYTRNEKQNAIADAVQEYIEASKKMASLTGRSLREFECRYVEASDRNITPKPLEIYRH